MSKPAVAQPPPSEGWVNILDRIEARLDEALGAADLRAASLPLPSETPIAAAHRMELTGVAERILGLRQRGSRSEALAADEDLTLGVAEDALRRKLAEVTALRQKLAAWPGRAIS
jgi:hypothetical protein